MGLNDSSFPLLPQFASEKRLVGARDDMDPGGDSSAGRVRRCAWYRAVQTKESARSVFRLDAVALRYRTGLWRSDRDLGIQRIALDGAVGMDRTRQHRTR